MTNIQRAFCVFLSLIFLCVVAALTGDFFKHGEIYRQLPLYCFLEKKALQEETGRDRETEMLLKEKNEEHLGEEVEAENRKEQEALLMAEAEEAEKCVDGEYDTIGFRRAHETVPRALRLAEGGFIRGVERCKGLR